MRLDEKVEFTEEEKKVFGTDELVNFKSTNQIRPFMEPRFYLCKKGNRPKICLGVGIRYRINTESQLSLKEQPKKWVCFEEQDKVLKGTSWQDCENTIAVFGFDETEKIINAIKNNFSGGEDDDYIIALKTHDHYIECPWVGVEFVDVEKLNDDIDWDEIEEGSLVRYKKEGLGEFGFVFFTLEGAIRNLHKIWGKNFNYVTALWKELEPKIDEFYSEKSNLKSRIRGRRGVSVSEPTDEEWWDTLSPEDKAAMLRKMRSSR